MGFMGAGGQRVMTMAAVMIAAGVMLGGREAGSAGVKDRRTTWVRAKSGATGMASKAPTASLTSLEDI